MKEVVRNRLLTQSFYVPTLMINISDKLSAHDKFLFFFWSLARYWGKILSQNTASEQFQEQICTCAPSSIERAIEDVF